MIENQHRAVCEIAGCSERSPFCSDLNVVLIWLLSNRWEAAWHFGSHNAEPSFRVRCPEHWSCRK